MHRTNHGILVAAPHWNKQCTVVRPNKVSKQGDDRQPVHPLLYRTPTCFLRNRCGLWMVWISPFAQEQEEFGVRGGVLADDMGLGKTLQCLALIISRRSPRPTLVVCPISLILQWEAEILNKTIGLKHCIYHGSDRSARYAKRHGMRWSMACCGV